MVDRSLKGREFTVQSPTVNEDFRKLTGTDYGEGWTDLEFMDPLSFTRIGQTVDGASYWGITRDDGSGAYFGKFTFRATLRKGYTGGPPGSATELFVQMEEGSARLAEKYSPPKAPPGVRAILPGQVVVRRIKEGELAGLDDRYLVELPGGRAVRLLFSPWPEKYAFRVSVSRNGVPVPTALEEGFVHVFESRGEGIHELRIQAGAISSKEPDSYRFHVRWGKSLSSGGKLLDHTVGWRTGAVTGGAETRGKDP